MLLLVTASGAGLIGSVMLSQATQTSAQALPDFTLSSTPVTQNMFQGSLTTLRIDLFSLNGFAGSVNLQAGLSPQCLELIHRPQPFHYLSLHRLRLLKTDDYYRGEHDR